MAWLCPKAGVNIGMEGAELIVMPTYDEMYTVNQWGSHPDQNNDDCWTGEDFDTLEAALAAFNADPADLSVRFMELDGPVGSDLYQVRQISGRKPYRIDNDDWQRERAMQAGMGLGIDAYNDEMGY